MPGRHYHAHDYRFGYNGKENDNEVKGNGNQQNYGFRIYDPRISKFLSVDPLTKSYPWYTPYQFAGNKPIWATDLDGKEESLYELAKMGYFGKTGSKIVIAVTDAAAETLKESWSFISHDAYQIKTWEGAGLFLEEVVLSSDPFSNVTHNPNTPQLDATVQNFNKNVLQGDAYSRTKYVSKLAFNIGFAYAGNKGLGALKSAVVAKYMSGPFFIGPRTLANITEHLAQFGFKAENEVMLARMKQIAAGELKATEIDINFAKHELRETELMKQGMNYEEAHEAVLKEQNMYVRDYEKKLYTKEAIEAGDAQRVQEAEDECKQ